MNFDASKIALIVLTYNSEKWIDPLIESLFESDPPLPKVIFVDNNSADNTGDKLSKLKDNIKIITNDKNIGFAAGCNIGISAALDDGADFIGLINPDARVAPNWLFELFCAIEERGHEGIFAPLQLTYDGLGLDPEMRKGILCNCPEFADDLWRKNLRKSYRIPAVYGGAMVIHRSVFEKIGLFDECFFLYGEDEDFCRRAKRHGFPFWLVTHSHVYHWHTQAQSDPEDLPKAISPHIRRSRLILSLKEPGRAWAGRCISVAGTLTGRGIRGILKGSFDGAFTPLKDFAWLAQNLSRIRRSRDKDILLEKNISQLHEHVSNI